MGRALVKAKRSSIGYSRLSDLAPKEKTRRLCEGRKRQKLRSAEFIEVQDRPFLQFMVTLEKDDIEKFLQELNIQEGAVVKLIISGDKIQGKKVSVKTDEYTELLERKGASVVIWDFRTESAAVPRVKGISKMVDLGEMLERYLLQLNLEEAVFKSVLLEGKKVLLEAQNEFGTKKH